MKTEQYLLIDVGTKRVKHISADTAHRLNTLSAISRNKQQHPKPNNCFREIQTVPIGIPLFTGIIQQFIDKTDMHLYAGFWLLVLTYSFDDAGTPSSTTPPLSPTPPTLRASGIYKDSGANVYIEHTQSLYLSKREPGKPRSSCPAGGSL